MVKSLVLKVIGVLCLIAAIGILVTIFTMDTGGCIGCGFLIILLLIAGVILFVVGLGLLLGDVKWVNKRLILNIILIALMLGIIVFGSSAIWAATSNFKESGYAMERCETYDYPYKLNSLDTIPFHVDKADCIEHVEEVYGTDKLTFIFLYLPTIVFLVAFIFFYRYKKRMQANSLLENS